MASRFRRRAAPRRRTFLASAALGLVAAAAQAQTALAPVIVTGRGEPAAAIGGWGDVPLSRAPFSAAIVERERIAESGTQRLADLARLDASVRDSYNAEGYWDMLAVRGYVLDNRSNYRRDGLPINAETRIPLDNKERLEVLRGTSGLQAGVSAPGGLVNYVVKRPTEQPLRQATLGWRERGSVLGAVDLSERFGADRAFGLRLNAAAERLQPRVRDTRGDRHLLALAGDWRLAPGMLLEAEVEQSRQSQPSVPGFSMLGDVVPPAGAIDPRINLNNQPWTLPVVFDNTDASLRFTQRLAADWRWTLQAATQRLRTDDRTAFPFGCAGEDAFDSFCSDGRFDYYDFRSENERRRTDALQVALHGALRTGPVAHTLTAGVQGSRLRARFGAQVFSPSPSGPGHIDGTVIVEPNTDEIPPIPDRTERNTELFLQDAARLGATTAWIGVRHTRLAREATDVPRFTRTITTPSLAVSHEVAAGQLVYASYGQGVETAVTPNNPIYGAAAGRPLEPLKSRQAEVGVKGTLGAVSWSAALFDIRRPTPTDLRIDDDNALFFLDGTARHRGLDGSVAWRTGPWWLQGSLQWLHARRTGSSDPALNGKRPTNVPAATLTLYARHDVAALPGLALHGNLLAESGRMVRPDNSARIPGYARFDAGLRYAQQAGAARLVWRAGVDNVLDRRAWRESPFQFAHVYLFPLAPRTWRLSVEATL